MLKGATNLFKAHNSEWLNLLFTVFSLQIKPVKSVKANWRIFIFCTLGTNGLNTLLFIHQPWKKY